MTLPHSFSSFQVLSSTLPKRKVLSSASFPLPECADVAPAWNDTSSATTPCAHVSIVEKIRCNL
jgi:hypothetical protein